MKIFASLVAMLLFFSNFIFSQCIDSTLINPTAMCPLQYDPICGCNGKTYQNACLAQITDGVSIGSPGTCSMESTFTVCEGESIEIGLPTPLPMAQYNWNPSDGLSCSDCANPVVTTTLSSTIELEVIDSASMSSFYYFEVLVDDNCPVDCIDPALINPDIVCNAQFEPVCGCNGKTYGNACLAENEGGLTSWTTGACAINDAYDVCEGENIQIEFIDGPDQAVYSWNPTDNLSCTDCPNPTVTPTADSIYELTVTNLSDSSNSYYYYEVSINSDCVVACIDSTLINPDIVCNAQFEPVCGCNGKTYGNACLAENEGGLTSWTTGACPITETYTICEGDSVQIGIDGMVGNTVLSWLPFNTLSCSDCPAPYASPNEQTVYELQTFTTIGMTNEYTYYEVIIEDCSKQCTNNNVAFSYEKVGFLEVSDPVFYGANKYCFKEISPVEDDCSYFWNFGNGGSIPSQNPCNIEFPYIKNGSPVDNPVYNVCLSIYRCDGTTIGTCCTEILSEAPVCDCANIDAPICGVDGNTYPSACLAGCEFVEVAYTGNCCDINNLPWLDEAVLDLCDNCVSSVEFIEFEGSNYIAFWADNENCSDALTTIYNCDGSVFCSIGGIAGLNECPSLSDNYTTIESIWEKEIYCGLCGFESPTQVNWLQNFSDGSHSINSYIYNDETVFYIENCDSGLDYVTTCDSTFMCGWGGIDNLNGEGCPDFFAEAFYIEEIIPCACIDLSLYDSSPGCPQFYAPVCGCDGVTYSNFCLAKAQGGVTSWVAGPCEAGRCADTISIANTFLSSGTYKANLVLQVASKALNGHSVNLNSGESIELLEGFDVPATSNLNILNTYCD